MTATRDRGVMHGTVPASRANEPIPGLGPVTELPGYGPVRERQHAGNLPVDDRKRGYVYVWFVESQSDPEHDPVVIWLNGGPGTSSFIGQFTEGGPYRIVTDPEVRLADNPFSWNRRANLMMIDQPTGTGLSVALDDKVHARTELQASGQLYHALQCFYRQLPEFRSNDLYLFGESYAGVYVPLLATAILEGNAAGRPRINLRGVGVGDGWVDPIVQQQTYGEYAYAHGLIDPVERRHVAGLYDDCACAIRDSQPVASRHADKVCNRIEEYISKVSGGTNVYDVRMIGDYDFAPIGVYLDRPDVRAALNVAPQAAPWHETAKRVAYLLERGEQDSWAWLYPRLFESLRVLIYSGVYDMDCNFMGTDAWLAGQHWSYRDDFLKQSRRPWLVGGRVAGSLRQADSLMRSVPLAGDDSASGGGSLTQVVIRGAGHLVPMDVPAVALALLEGFLHGDPPLAAHVD
jgi:carboxypeptidase C (cathepsin A)